MPATSPENSYLHPAPTEFIPWNERERIPAKSPGVWIVVPLRETLEKRRKEREADPNYKPPKRKPLDMPHHLLLCWTAFSLAMPKVGEKNVIQALKSLRVSEDLIKEARIDFSASGGTWPSYFAELQPLLTGKSDSAIGRPKTDNGSKCNRPTMMCRVMYEATKDYFHSKPDYREAWNLLGIGDVTMHSTYYAWRNGRPCPGDVVEKVRDVLRSLS